MRSTKYLTPRTGPEQPKRLRGHRDDLRIEVHEHRVMPLQMRLARDPAARRRGPVVPPDRPLPRIRPDLPHRSEPLEPLGPTRFKANPPPLETTIDELDLEIPMLQLLELNHRAPDAGALRHHTTSKPQAAEHDQGAAGQTTSEGEFNLRRAPASSNTK
ncbi:MAG TPA: hypothetical protein VFQ37_17905 [Mycobacterium sp.]|nr:hypothetical protein [Mycobacterium sp.]